MPKKFLNNTGVGRLWKAIEEELATKADTSDVTTIQGQISTLVGNDTNKSVRTIANEELATQLIPANAGEALDTLQEIAAWIQAHPGDASAMNSAIAALQSKITLGTHDDGEGNQIQYSTVKAYVEAMIAGLSASAHSHTNLQLLESLSAQDIALWNAALQDGDVIALTDAEIAAAIAQAKLELAEAAAAANSEEPGNGEGE